MYLKKYIFSQRIDFLPKRVFDGLASKYSGDNVKTLQLLESIVSNDVWSTYPRPRRFIYADRRVQSMVYPAG